MIGSRCERLLLAALALAFAAATTEASADPPQPSEASAVTKTIPCSACHTTTGWRSKDARTTTDLGEPVFDHAKTGFPLTGQHMHTACVACHDGKKKVKRACVSCHEDTHRGRLMQTCDSCHSPIGWRNTKALEMHRLTRFPLTGMHVLADCTECHRRASEHQWTGAPVDCFACHEKDYRRRDLRPVHAGATGPAGAPPFPRDCSLCHRAVAWAPARFDAALLTGTSALPLRAGPAAAGAAAPANHDARFPVSFGLHRFAACDDCHAQASTPRMVRCTGCHAHEPVRLAAQHKTPVATNGAACLSCHPGGMRR